MRGVTEWVCLFRLAAQRPDAERSEPTPPRERRHSAGRAVEWDSKSGHTDSEQSTHGVEAESAQRVGAGGVAGYEVQRRERHSRRRTPVSEHRHHAREGNAARR